MSARRSPQNASHEQTVQHQAPNVYFDRQFDMEGVKILPGEYRVVTGNMLLVTVLGSCVSACIRDTYLRIGGMNHFMLPDGGGGDGPMGAQARYGAYAMEVLVNELLTQGARRERLQAKIFGGGRVVAGMTQTNVGERNAQFVVNFLQMEKIPIEAQDLLDIYPRKVYYFPHTGRVLVRKLKSTHNEQILQPETEYRKRLRVDEVEGDVELFG